MNVSDLILTRLREWNIERIYGYPSDGTNEILGALNWELSPMKGCSESVALMRQLIRQMKNGGTRFL